MEIAQVHNETLSHKTVDKLLKEGSLFTSIIIMSNRPSSRSIDKIVARWNSFQRTGLDSN